MKRFFSTDLGLFGRFLFTGGFPKFILWAIALVIFFYAEENWRGAHAWAVTKAFWEAKGESFDRTIFIPPDVPDDQNLAALPLFQLEPEREADGSSYLSDVALKKAMRYDSSGNPTDRELPTASKWQKGKPPDLEAIRKGIALLYAKAFPGTPPPADALAQFDALYPFLNDLRTAMATRPLCRFPADYAVPLWTRPLGLITAQIKVSQLVTLHAVLALNAGKTDLALQDIRLNFELMSGTARDPSLVGGLVTIGMNAIGTGAIYNGLTLHAWNDAQLAEIDRLLKQNDFLANDQFVMRSEVVMSFVPMMDWLKKSWKFDPLKWLSTSGADQFSPAFFHPTGWLDQNKSLYTNDILTGVHAVAPKTHRVFLEPINELVSRTDRPLHFTDAIALWSFFALTTESSTLKGTIKFAQAQVWIDETRLAVALERHRLAHGAYPDTLNTLTPAYLAELPHDIITGEPYRYQLRPDGTFLLYSVGWNGKDDGGQIVYEKDNPDRIDYQQGDWPWPVPADASR